MSFAATLPLFLTRLRDWGKAKSERWLLEPAERYVADNVRGAAEAVKVVLMGARNAALLSDGAAPGVSVAHRCRAGGDDPLAFLGKLLARASSRQPEIDLVLLLEDGATPERYLAIARVLHDRVNLHAFTEAAHLAATLPAIVPGADVTQRLAELEEPGASAQDLCFEGTPAAPAYFANLAREHCKSAAPIAKVCAICFGPGWSEPAMADAFETLEELLEGWYPVVLGAPAPLGRKFVENQPYVPSTRGALALAELAFVLEADACIGVPGAEVVIARLVGTPVAELPRSPDLPIETAEVAKALAGPEREV